MGVIIGIELSYEYLFGSEYDGVKIFVNFTLLELYKSDKSPLVYCLFILFKKKTQPLSKGESVTILLCDLFFLIRMCFEFDLIVKLKLETFCKVCTKR